MKLLNFNAIYVLSLVFIYKRIDLIKRKPAIFLSGILSTVPFVSLYGHLSAGVEWPFQYNLTVVIKKGNKQINPWKNIFK
jgi:hypothetical protein